MRKVLLFLILLAPWASAQEATLTSPVARPSEAKYKMQRVVLEAGEAYLTVSVQDSSNEEIRSITYRTVDVAGVFAAIDTVRSGETGGVLRRANFRLLGFLLDEGYLPPVSLVP